MTTATTTWTCYFVTDDVKCITFFDSQKFEFRNETQTQLTVSFVRHSFMPLYKKLQHHWLNPFTSHPSGPKIAAPLPSVKKLFLKVRRMFWSCIMRLKSILFIRGIVLPNPVKMAGATVGMHRRKLCSESTVSSNHLFFPPSVNRITLVCVWDQTGVLKTSLRLRDLHDLYII